jgi:hypothetical protein
VHISKITVIEDEQDAKPSHPITRRHLAINVASDEAIDSLFKNKC